MRTAGTSLESLRCQVYLHVSLCPSPSRLLILYPTHLSLLNLVQVGLESALLYTLHLFPMYLRQLLFLLLLSAVALSQATADSSPAGPTLPGTASNCSRWYKIKKGDTCDSVQKSLGITAKDFLAWNPDVSADCLKNFWVDQAYCVGVGPGSPSPGSTLAPSVSVSSGASVPLPSPTVAHSGSSSPTVISSRSSSRTVVSSGSSPLSTPATASPSGASTYTFNHPITSQTLISPSSTETAWPPTKTHPGQPATCNKWHQIQYGETCSKIKALYSLITMDDL